MTESATIVTPEPALFRTLCVRFISGAVMVGVVIFAPAGGFGYWNGWLLMAALFVPMMFVLVYLYTRDRPLLEKRLRVHETQSDQKAYAKLSLLWFAISFALPGFDYRFGWSHVPIWLVGASVVVMIFGYILFVVAMVQNSYASRIIEIQTGQRVVDTGLYSIVRHPMYMAACIMFPACPLVLGSYYALIPTLLLPVLLVYRLRNEEKVLRADLAGYAEYTRRVRFRLIPFVW